MYSKCLQDPLELLIVHTTLLEEAKLGEGSWQISFNNADASFSILDCLIL
jgi:hypothetical protein